MISKKARSVKESDVNCFNESAVNLPWSTPGLLITVEKVLSIIHDIVMLE